MTSRISYYKKLLDVLDRYKGSPVETNDPRHSAFRKKLSNPGILDFLVWEYDLDAKTLAYLSLDNGYDYHRLDKLNLWSFLQQIHPRYKQDLLQLLITFFQFLTVREVRYNTQYSIQAFLPVKLKSKSYIYSGMYVIPEYSTEMLSHIYFAIIPLKKFDAEGGIFNAFNAFKKDEKLTRHLTGMISQNYLQAKELIDITQNLN